MVPIDAQELFALQEQMRNALLLIRDSPHQWHEARILLRQVRDRLDALARDIADRVSASQQTKS
jgi:hypothetical protein